ncbi:hypothetical protein ACN47E_004985 [Coniothyrium glycines]
MRQRSGCKACRERHIKCVKLRDSDKCKYCTERKKPCIRGNAFRFRPVKAVKFNAGEDIGSAEQSLEFRLEQTWVSIPTSLHFVAPNTDGDEVDFDVDTSTTLDLAPDPDLASQASGEPSNTQLPQNDSLSEPFSIADLSEYQQNGPFTDISVPVFDNNDLPSIHDVLSTGLTPTGVTPAGITPPIVTRTNSRTTIQRKRTISSSVDHRPSVAAFHPSPTSIPRPSQSPHVIKKSPLTSNNNNNNNNISPFNSSAFSPSSALNLKWPVNNEYEARLFHHYIVYCTDWIDVVDARRLFEKEVPKRAAHFPVIRDGILGLAARHLWLMGKVEEDWSQTYVDQCLQALIVALEDPLAHWDENFLVAVILLRLHEEIGETDEQCHHFGTARILNSISSFAADGGLRETASWVSLRQHIYVSLTTQQPLNLSLDNYRHSAVFREFDEEAWANRIIFLFATVLQSVFENTSNGISKDKWKDLHDEVDEWYRTKPWAFSPIYVEPGAGEKFTGSWPELPCTQGVVAVGLQYYHLCKILLTIYSPNASLVGLAGVRARRATDATIRTHIRITIGYGVSNSHCANAMFQGSHILSACGAYIVDEREQEACVEYLTSLQRLIGWRTTNVIADLRQQWTN